MADAPSQDAEAIETASGGSNRKLIIILAALAVIGGGGAFFVLSGDQETPAEKLTRALELIDQRESNWQIRQAIEIVDELDERQYVDPDFPSAQHYIRGLAELRGRNVEWAERAVREAVSLPASEALALKVIDVVASDLDDLLKQLNGRDIDMNGQTLRLNTTHADVQRVMPDWRSRLLAVIGDPSIAYILMLLGIYGLIYEFANPGMLFPGVAGGICLLLALFALQLMPVSYAGLGLILLGIGLMAAEAFVPSFGVLGLGGIVAFVLGSVMLIDTDLPGYGISWALIAPLAAVSAMLSFAVGGMALTARRQPVITGSEELPGSEGEALDDISAEGWARVHGELWRVRSPLPLARGTRLRVTARHGLTLDVEPITATRKENDHV